MISKETINEVLERTSLVELASETVRLKRQGSNYVGLCPFHSENGASFHIRHDKNFHCFGCGASGNAIGFQMRQSGLSFPEAVEDLATKLGISVIRDKSNYKSKDETYYKEKIFELNNIALEYFETSLTKCPKVVSDYITKRGLSQAAITHFNIGYAPAAGLVALLKGRGFDEQLLVQAGLARRNQSGKVYDYFRERLIFPIKLDQKRVAGFGGRCIPEMVDPSLKDRTPKYLNSLESPVYEKSKILYALPQALSSLRGRKSIYVVEGYLDVVGLWIAGVTNVVATCGTAVTEQHIRRLKTAVSKLEFLFDGDEAGRRGAGKTFPMFVNSGLEVNSVFLPEGEDPDSIATIQKSETEAELAKLERKDLFDCYLEQLALQQGGEALSELGAAGKGKVAKIAAQILAQVSNPVERADLQERLALLLKVNSESIASLTRVESKAAPSPESITSSGPAIRPVELLPAFDREVLRCVMALRGSPADGILTDQELCSILQVETLSFLTELVDAQRRASLNKAEALRVLKAFGESWLKLWKESDILAEDGKATELFETLKLRVSKLRLDEQIEQLRLALKEAKDPVEQMNIAQRKLELERSRDAAQTGF
jgi:DNA primase